MHPQEYGSAFLSLDSAFAKTEVTARFPACCHGNDLRAFAHTVGALRSGTYGQSRAETGEEEALEAALWLPGTPAPPWAVWEGGAGAGGTCKEGVQGPSPATLSSGLNERSDQPGPHPGLQPGWAPAVLGRK